MQWLKIIGVEIIADGGEDASIDQDTNGKHDETPIDDDAQQMPQKLQEKKLKTAQKKKKKQN